MTHPARTTLLLALAVAMGSSAMVPAVQAQQNCEKYGYLALKQARDNERRKCGFSGPRWSVDLNAHVAWCNSVAPQQWTTELRERAKALQSCRR